MAVTFTWNSTFEAQPGSGLARNMIDNELRKTRRGVREIMELEHEWGPYTDADSGAHTHGETTVLLTGNAATRDGLTSMQEGALYFLNDSGVKELYVYTSGAWVAASSIDHGDLSNLLSNSHPQYMLLDLDNAMTDALDMGANKILSASPPAAGYDDYLVYGTHEGIVHSELGDSAAILDDAIIGDHLDIVQVSLSGTIAALGVVEIPLDKYEFVFFPNFYASTTTVQILNHEYVDDGATAGFALFNESTDTPATYRVNFEAVQ